MRVNRIKCSWSVRVEMESNPNVLEIVAATVGAKRKKIFFLFR
jgi:hypothetical protein